MKTRLIKLISLFTFLVILFHSLPHILAKTISIDVPSQFKKEGILEYDISSLKDGNYYISLGRPITSCSIYLDGKLIYSNYTDKPASFKQALLVGAYVGKKTYSKMLQINCDGKNISTVDFSHYHNPVLANYNSGIVLQLFRAFTIMFLGPFSAGLLLISIFLSLFRPPAKLNLFLRKRNSTPYLIFGLTSLIYIISLSHYPRLLLEPEKATILHIFLRHAFALSSSIYLMSFTRIRKSLLCIHTFLIAIDIGIVMFYQQNSHLHLFEFYKYTYFFFPLITAVIAYDIGAKKKNDFAIVILQATVWTWAILQVNDWFRLFFGFGSYTAPALMVLLSGVATYINIKEYRLSEHINEASQRILQIINSNAPLASILDQIAMVVSSKTHFTRVSAYLDGYALGLSDSTSNIFLRVMESGYSKDTKKDREIVISDNRGQFMAETLAKGELILRQGSNDGAWFIIVPIDKHACINLSNDKVDSELKAYESLTILQELMPSLASLNSKIISQSIEQGLALNKLKIKLGPGTFKRNLGAIFADVANYTKQVEKYGQPCAEFINTVYIPSLIKAVSEFATPEFLRGDEVYLVIVEDLLMDDKITVTGAMVQSLDRIAYFMNETGIRLCAERGFEPIRLTVGATIGEATIVCDKLKVRTGGQSVNEAKRIQEYASTGEILVSLADQNVTEFSGRLGEEFTVLIKKNIVKARHFNTIKEDDEKAA